MQPCKYEIVGVDPRHKFVWVGGKGSMRGGEVEIVQERVGRVQMTDEILRD